MWIFFILARDHQKKNMPVAILAQAILAQTSLTQELSWHKRCEAKASLRHPRLVSRYEPHEIARASRAQMAPWLDSIRTRGEGHYRQQQSE